jgi:hypothetical protein
MRKIKLGLKKKTVPQRIAQGNLLKSSMTGNANFVTPNPSLATLGAKTDAMQAKLTARDAAVEAAKMATEQLHTAVADYDATVTTLAAYAENITGGDAAKLESGGFELRADAVPVTELGQVKNLDVKTNGYPGRFLGDWDPLHGAKAYEVQLSPEPMTDSTWETVKVAPASKVKLDDLPSGSKRWLRVRGIAKNLAGQWSEPVAKIVP